jgi:hypothetical protein
VSRRRRPFALATVGVAVVGAIGASLVSWIGAHADAPPDAAETLRATQRAVAYEEAFTYDLYGESRVEEGLPGGDRPPAATAG